MTARQLPASDSAALAEASRLLRAGQVVAIPTETVYGLVALPQGKALERLVEIKRRSADKGIQLLIDSLEQVRGWVELPAAAAQLAERYWPGGLTLVLPMLAGAGLPELLSGGRGTLGLRLPDHDVPRGLARELGPLAASSANISGMPPATDAELVMASLGDELTLVVDDGPVRGGVSSTVVSLSADGSHAQVLREGALPAAEVLEVLHNS